MTSPRHGFGAHDCDLLSFCGLNERLDTRMEFLRLHIIGEAAERSVVPSRVEGVCPCVAQSAQFLHSATVHKTRTNDRRISSLPPCWPAWRSNELGGRPLGDYFGSDRI